jgi:RND family efflux transporter MFP subunit
LAVALALIGGIVYRGITTRAKATSTITQETQTIAVSTVSVVQPKPTAPSEEIILPGNLQAFTDAPIYARTNGYLKRWYVDIGARVKAGQLLAEIDTPEVDQQLQQARADHATADANYRLAQTTEARWVDLLKTDSVAKQATDEKVGDRQAKQAIVDSMSANVKRLEDLQSFQKIYAPFDGVITARFIDIGALIIAGTGTGTGKALFQLAATNKLRVYVNVPQIYSRSTVPGVPAELTLAELPGQRFKGTLVRTADAIDTASRTLLAEIDVNNVTGRLLPGAYAQVHLKLKSRSGTQMFVLPVNALIFRSQGLQVAVVQDGKANLISVSLGRDFGTEVEVVSGLKGGESVIVNPSDSLVSGTPVHVAPASARGGTS